MRPEFIPVGTVVNAHGIRGEVKVNPAGFDPEFIASFKTLYIGGQPTAVKSARVHKSTVLLTLPGVDTMDDALALKGKSVSIRRTDARLPAGQYFDAELEGCAGGVVHRRGAGQAGRSAPLSRPQGLSGAGRSPRIPDPRRPRRVYRLRGPGRGDHPRPHDERTCHR